MLRSITLSSLLVVLLAGIVGLSGCSESAEKTQGQDLLDAVTRTQRLVNQAQALMSQAVFKNSQNDQVEQISEETWSNWRQMIQQANELKQQIAAAEQSDNSQQASELMQQYQDLVRAHAHVLTPSAVDPKAKEVLSTAETLIRKAMDSNAQAPDEVKALAEQAKGMVLAEMASLDIYQADELRMLARNTMARAAADLTQLRNRQSQINAASSQAEAMRRASDQLAERMAEVSETREQLSSQLNQLQANLADLQTRAQDLTDQINQVMAQYNQDLIRAKGIPGQKGLDAMKAATNLLDKANQLNSQLRQTEYRIDETRSQIVLVQGQISQAQARLDRSSKIDPDDETTSFQERFDTSLQQAQQLHQTLQGSQNVQNLTEKLTRIAQLLDAAEQREDDAVNALNAAENAFASAQALSADRSAALTALLADVRSELAQLNKARVITQKSANLLVAAVGDTWPAVSTDSPPASLQTISQYVPDVAVTSEQMAEDFKKAAELYQQAARMADRSISWLYHQNRAVALVDQGGSEFQEALSEALRGNESVPMVVQSNRQIEQLSE